jgi:hypothetical protein
MTIGIRLLLTTAPQLATITIIGLGAPFFGDAESNEKTYSTLKLFLSSIHCMVLVLYTTVAEIGKLIGVGWLQDYIKTLAMIAQQQRLQFFRDSASSLSPGIDLSDTSDSEGCLGKESDLVLQGTCLPLRYPSIILSLFNLTLE